MTKLSKIGWLFTGVNIIILLIVVNAILANLPMLRVDLTKDKIHTLSPATTKIIKELDDVVNVKVYMSQDLPSNVKPLAADLKTILGEFHRINNGKFLVSYVDPSKDENAKNEATKNGIQPLQFSSVKNDKLEVSNGYLGLKVDYEGKQQVLPIAGDVGNLEYFLISTIKRMTDKELPNVVFIDGSQSQGKSNYMYFNQYLGKSYKLTNRSVTDNSDISKETDVLIIAGVKQKFDDKALGKINEYLKQNKGVIVFEGRSSVGENMFASKSPDTGIESWLKDKGITVDDKIVADASSTITTFRSSNNSFMAQYPYWIKVRPENIDRNVPVTSGLSNLVLPWVSPLFVSGNAQVLITSSEYNLLKDSSADLSPLVKIDISEKSDKKPLAALNIKDAKLAVVGNSMFLEDQFVQNTQENLIFGLNLVDYMTNDESLLSIRSKILSNYPIMQLSDISRQIIRYTNIFLPMVILLVISLVINIIRKRNNRKWLEI